MNMPLIKTMLFGIILFITPMANSMRIGRLLHKRAEYTISCQDIFYQHTRTCQLYKAAATGDTKTIRLLLDLGTPVDAADDYGMTPLMIAAYMAQKSTTTVLLAHGANVNAYSAFKSTPLIEAASNNSTEIPLAFLNKGAAIDAATAAGETALMRAAAMGNAYTLNLLLARGANPHNIDIYNENALTKAVHSNSLHSVTALLKKDVNMRLQNKWGISPLQIAYNQKNPSMLNLLYTYLNKTRKTKK